MSMVISGTNGEIGLFYIASPVGKVKIDHMSMATYYLSAAKGSTSRGCHLYEGAEGVTPA
jgi:hypothetical protein